MKTISNSDSDAVLRILEWATAKGDNSTRDRERRRIANKLLKKLQGKWKQ